MEPVPQTECDLRRKNITDKIRNNTGHTNRIEDELTETETRLLERIISLEEKWNWIIGLLILNLGGVISLLITIIWGKGQ